MPPSGLDAALRAITVHRVVRTLAATLTAQAGVLLLTQSNAWAAVLGRTAFGETDPAATSWWPAIAAGAVLCGAATVIAVIPVRGPGPGPARPGSPAEEGSLRVSAGISVDLDSATPPYEQIRAQVSSLIALGTLAPGSRLPTVRSLAADLGIAAGTVARAYRELEQSGLIDDQAPQRHRGRRDAGGRCPARRPGTGDRRRGGGRRRRPLHRGRPHSGIRRRRPAGNPADEAQPARRIRRESQFSVDWDGEHSNAL